MRITVWETRISLYISVEYAKVTGGFIGWLMASIVPMVVAGIGMVMCIWWHCNCMLLDANNRASKHLYLFVMGAGGILMLANAFNIYRYTYDIYLYIYVLRITYYVYGWVREVERPCIIHLGSSYIRKRVGFITYMYIHVLYFGIYADYIVGIYVFTLAQKNIKPFVYWQFGKICIAEL